jgi:type VI secretion system protein ImpG
MSDELFKYYERELQAIRRLSQEFAAAHPREAGRLRINADGQPDDPHVERLLDGTAFLAARVHARLDDEFPQLTDTLLNLLYPHYLAPFPSCAIVQFALGAEIQSKLEVPPGFAINTAPVRGQPCRYRTASPATVWPVKLESAQLQGAPFTAPPAEQALGAKAVLKLVLTTLNPGTKISALNLDQLRLFMRDSQPAALPLFETLLAHTMCIAVAQSASDPLPAILPASLLTQGGFAADEALLPWSERSAPGLRLLSEYFAFPQKFICFDLAGLDAKTGTVNGNRLEIYIYLRRSAVELERGVTAACFALGCAPVVNLFTKHCERIDLDHTRTEYKIVPDRHTPHVEIWSLTNVREGRGDASPRPWRPFYRPTGTAMPGRENETPQYLESRVPARGDAGGSDVMLAPYDPAFTPSAKTMAVLSIEALCLNRDLPKHLPSGNGQPVLTALTPVSAVESIICLTHPTPTLRPELQARHAWRLISHLSLGHIPLAGDGEDGAAALQEIMRLYDLRNEPDSRAAREALLAVRSSLATARIPNTRPGAFGRGLNVELEFDPAAFRNAGLITLCAVLARFLAMQASINSFVRTSVRLRGRDEPEISFAPQSGTRTLL